MRYVLLCVLALPLAASAQDVRTRHDTVKNSIRDVRAVVDTTGTTIVGTVGDPIPGCVGKVCGGSLTDPIPGCVGRVCGGTGQ